MAKSSTPSSHERPQAPTPDTPVYNHTGHMIGIGITTRKAGTPGIGPEAYTIEFLPGNNSKTRAEMDLCEGHPLWGMHVKRGTHLGLTGKSYKGVELEVGLHDEEFEIESKELGIRMFELRQKRAG